MFNFYWIVVRMAQFGSLPMKNLRVRVHLRFKQIMKVLLKVSVVYDFGLVAFISNKKVPFLWLLFLNILLLFRYTGG